MGSTEPMMSARIGLFSDAKDPWSLTCRFGDYADHAAIVMFRTISLPAAIWSVAVYNWFRGKGYFSDPLGKPSLLRFFVDQIQFMGQVFFLVSKPATEEALRAAKNPVTPESDDGIQVIVKDDYIEFQPPEWTGDEKHADGQETKGLIGVIIVPGALVSPYAYAPMARELTRLGYPCFTLILPLGFASFGWSTAGTIIMRRPTSGRSPPKKWVLMGHSLGGVGIEQFINGRPDMVDGAVYMACSSKGIKPEIKLPVLRIYGGRDGLMALNSRKLRLGDDTCIIEGGNHQGFASYTNQLLDWKATITNAEQRNRSVEAVVGFIKNRVAPTGSKNQS